MALKYLKVSVIIICVYTITDVYDRFANKWPIFMQLLRLYMRVKDEVPS